MELFIIIARWAVAAVAAVLFLAFWIAGMISVIRREQDPFSNSPAYHVSAIVGILAVVCLPVGSFMDRAPYAFLAVLPEIAWPLDLVLTILRRKR